MAETLGPYSLDKRIGAGGMADVFLARGPRGVCVIKRPHPHLCANPDFVRMFLDEASILASVHHPNIAQIFDLGQVNGAYYLAMEYVPGFDLMTISLEHERQGELMAPELCARIIADVAGALHHAHEVKHPKTGQALTLIHRDVTPHNVLLSTTGIVKLIDFGVARAATATHRTQAGLVKGKYPYMAPEQITGQDIDRRVDVYALGLVLYELLTNTRAIAGNTEIEQIDNARAARIRPIEQLRPNLPMPLRQILASCVHPDREGRYATALALQEDLEKYLRFVGQPIGQEDLLRLFRVVAAEVAHLEPAPAPQLTPAEAQHTWGGARTEQEVPTEPPVDIPPEELALGVAPTAPSMRLPVPPAAAHAKATLDVDVSLPKELQSTSIIPGRETRLVKEALAAHQEGELDTIPAPLGPGIGRWVVLGALALTVIAGAGLLLHSAQRTPIVELVDAGLPLIAPLEVFDAGEAAAVASPVEPEFVDAGEAAIAAVADAATADDRAATVTIDADVPMAITSDGHSWGSTPVKLELAAGDHVIMASNKAAFCEKRIEVTLAPGDARALKLKNALGSALLKAEPFAEVFTVNGRRFPVAMGNSVKELTLCEGRYTVGAQLQGKKLSKVVEISAGNKVTVELGVFN